MAASLSLGDSCGGTVDAVAAEDDYNAAKGLVEYLIRTGPCSMPPERTDAAISALLIAAGVEDSAAAQRGKGVRKGYVQLMAHVARKVGKLDNATELLSAQMIDFEKQSEGRRRLASELETASTNLPRGPGSPRWREMLLGSAIGDSYGAGLEFYDGGYIKEKINGSTWVVQRGDPVFSFGSQSTNPVPDHSGGGQNYQEGMYTDDCEMTVGFMHALMHDDRKGELTKDTLIQWWQEEYEKASSHYLLSRIWALVGVGRNGHGGISQVYNAPEEEKQTLLEAQRKYTASAKYPGNAPPMRALPLAFLPDDLMLKYSVANAESTHPNPKAVSSTLCIALAARHFVVDRASPGSIISEVLVGLNKFGTDAHSCFVPDTETMAYLSQVDSLPPPKPVDCKEPWIDAEVLEQLCGPQPIWKTAAEGGDKPRKVNGLNADAMRTAGCVLWVLKHHVTDQPLNTLLWSMYIGGDVDSSAALCLAMVGGREGLHFGKAGGLPMHMIEKVEGVEYLVETADKFGKWVEDYKVDTN